MKTLDEFRAFRDAELVPALAPIRADSERARKLMFNTFLAGLCVALAALPAAYVSTRNVQASLLVAGICFALAVFAVVVEAFCANRKSRDAFKALIVPRVVSFIDPKLRYAPEMHMPESAFVSSGIWTDSVDRFSGEDLVSGSYEDVAIAFSEVHAERRIVTTDSKGRRSERWETIFRGVFLSADFNKEFRTRTVVVPDLAESSFGSYLGHMLQKMNFSRSGRLIELEDPEFEKAFAVYGDDQVEARYVLSPALMRRMLALREKFGAGVSFSFIGSRVCVAIPKSRDLFELEDALRRPESLDGLFSDMSSFAGVVDDLNLTLRIWSKE